jgi:hypothetical protein
MKTRAIVEEALLGYLGQKVLTPENVRLCLQEANAHLEELARRPRHDVTPLERELKQIESQRQTLKDLMLTHPKAKTLDTVIDNVAELEKRRKQVQAELHKLEQLNQAPPPPISLEEVEALTQDMRSLLNQSPAQAAEAIGALTGPIRVHHKPGTSSRRSIWFAQVKSDLVPLIKRVAKDKNAPLMLIAQYLTLQKWSFVQDEEVVMRALGYKERFAAEILKLHEQGLGNTVIATRLGVNQRAVYAVIEQATGKPATHRKETGGSGARKKEPKPKGSKQRKPNRKKPSA